MPETVFRSNHRSVLAAVDEADRQKKLFEEQVAAFRAEFPFLADPEETMLSVWRGPRETSAHGFRWDAAKPTPHGWRSSDGSGVNVIVPSKRSKEGRTLHARFAALRYPMPPQLWPGMPVDFFPAVMLDERERADAFKEYGNKVFHPGYRMMDGYWWVTWGCRLPERLVDLAVWEQMPLSAYYLAVEAAPPSVDLDQKEPV